MTDLAVLGSPISHSKTPRLQELFGKYCGIKVKCEKIETDESNYIPTVQTLKQKGIVGFNCTMPLKKKASEHCDRLSENSAFLSSVNTVKIENGKLFGSTTDGNGLLLAYRINFGEIKSKKVLLFGTGGTARSIYYSFEKSGAMITVVNRSVGIFGDMFPHSTVYPFDLTEKLSESADVMINATPLGMTGKDSFSDLSFIEKTKENAIFIDAVYEPYETEFLLKAKQCRRKTLDGLYMLVCQGALSFEEWTGVKVGQNIIKQVYEELKGEMK